ncbi:MAG: hypothetical protein Q6J33_05205, partial [Gloeomargarita sp. DG_2_bins_126]
VAILKAILRPDDQVSFVPISGHCYYEPYDLWDVAQQVCPGISSGHYADLADVLPRIDEQKTTVISGSLYLIGQLLKSPLLN